MNDPFLDGQFPKDEFPVGGVGPWSLASGQRTEANRWPRAVLAWMLLMILLVLLLAVVAGCRRAPDPRFAPPPAGFTNSGFGGYRPDPGSPPVEVRPRRATASELLEAAQTGQVPEWFSAEERRAVEKIR